MSGRWRAGLWGLIAVAFVFAPPARAAAEAPPVQVELLADASAVAPGQPFKVGVLFRIAPEWHTYWKFPGDAGLPTAVTLELPKGFTAGELQWPLPQSFVQPGNVIGYGYTGSVMLIAEVTPPEGLPAGDEFTIRAKASWLSCHDICRPGRAALETELFIASQPRPANQALFREWAARLPQTKQALIAAGRLRSAVATVEPLTPGPGEKISISIAWETRPAKVEFFLAPPDSLLTGKPAVVAAGQGAEIEMTARPSGVGAPDGLDGLVVFTLPDGERDGFPVRFQFPVGNAATPARP